MPLQPIRCLAGERSGNDFAKLRQVKLGAGVDIRLYCRQRRNVRVSCSIGSIMPLLAGYLILRVYRSMPPVGNLKHLIDQDARVPGLDARVPV